MPPRSDPEPSEQEFTGGSRRWWLTVAVATVVAGAVRILSPGDGPFWRDEALFVFVSRIAPLGELLNHLHQHESHPPLFYLMMRGWTAVAGPGDAALRALPFALGVLLVPLVAWIGARAFGAVAGLAAAIIVAVHPNLAFHSVQVRPYSALMLVALASSYALWRIVETREWRGVIGYVLATLGMVYLHHWSWLLLAAQGAALLLVVVIGGTELRSWGPRVLVAWMTVGLGYLPMIPTFLRHSQLAGHPGEQFGPEEALGRFSDVTIAQLQSRVGVAVLLLAFGAVIMRRRGWSWAGAGRLRAYAVLALIPPLTVAIALPASASTNLLVPHTLTTLIPFVALGIGAGISALHADRRYLEGVLLIGLLATALGFDFRRLQGTAKSNAASLAEAIESHSEPSDVVIIAPDRYASSFNYYFDGRNQQAAYPSGGRRDVVYFDGYYDRIADTTTLRALSDSIRAFASRGARVWLVSDETIFGDTTAMPRQLPAENSAEEHLAGRVRARQVEKLLQDAYGPPDSLIVPMRGMPLLESIGAERFDPSSK